MTEYLVKGFSSEVPFGNKCLGRIFFETLQDKPQEKIILIEGDTGEEITYGQLQQNSIDFAKFLIDFGVKPEDVVAIVAENSWRYISALISCFYVGATACLLNHDYTSSELKHFFDISHPTIVFCTKKSLRNITTLIEEKKCIILDDAESFGNSKKFNPTDIDVTKPALMITSSGTQGFPKAVVLSQENIKSSFSYIGAPEIVGFNPKESTIGYLPLFHIFGTVVALGAVIFGTKLIIFDKFKPDKFLEAIQRHKITKLVAVPTVLQFLAKAPLVEKYDLSSVKDIISGAARITKELEEMVEERLDVAFVRQLYGLSEAVCVTLTPKNWKKSGSVGQVVTNAVVKICDRKTGGALPPNEMGEIRVKSGGVMLGYKEDEEQTKEAFDEEGFLKTGDLGYYDEDNFFYIVDRLKDVIKYKGFQVSPAELETILIQHPGVGDVGVVGVPDEKVGEVPVAFVVKQKGVEVTEGEIVEYVAGKISLQKRLYGGVRFVSEIPRNATGKILRRKLREIV